MSENASKARVWMAKKESAGQRPSDAARLGASSFGVESPSLHPSASCASSAREPRDAAERFTMKTKPPGLNSTGFNGISNLRGLKCFEILSRVGARQTYSGLPPNTRDANSMLETRSEVQPGAVCTVCRADWNSAPA